MPTSLEISRAKLQQRLNVVETALERHSQGLTFSRRVDRHALQEGIISILWQSWCWFCREVVIASARGAVTSSGLVTTSPYAAMTKPELVYIAKQLETVWKVGDWGFGGLANVIHTTDVDT
jgi:hypothetical protein